MRFFWCLLISSVLILQHEVIAEAEVSGIYKSVHSWSWEYEELFASWLGDVAADPEFFKKRNIPIDCADTVYGFRWIFARIHKLPMLTTTVDDGVISHETSNPLWSDLPTAETWEKDVRFLTALNYILRRSWTVTLSEDSYPVSLTNLLPGAFFLNLDSSKHVDLIYKMNLTDPKEMPFEFVSSTVPREIKNTKHLVYWYEAKPKTAAEGFRRFLWPVRGTYGWEYAEPQNMPDFSTEQFQLELGNGTFHNYVYNIVKPSMSQEALAQISLRELKLYLHERVGVVEKGYRACNQTRRNRRYCRNTKSKLYDIWSTPSRDKRIRMHFEATRQQISNAKLASPWQTYFLATNVFQVNSRAVNLYELSEVWSKNNFSSKPVDPPTKRWGVRGKIFGRSTIQILH